MSRVPPSYRIGRVLILLALSAAVYLLWTFAAAHWLAVADAWIGDVGRWARRLNPLAGPSLLPLE